MIWISIINRLSYDVTICPALMTDGILWFTDLSTPDPYGILPVVGGALSFVSMMSTTAQNRNVMFKKLFKFMKFFPLISVPIWMTFPAAFNLYWLIS